MSGIKDSVQAAAKYYIFTLLFFNANATIKFKYSGPGWAIFFYILRTVSEGAHK